MTQKTLGGVVGFFLTLALFFSACGERLPDSEQGKILHLGEGRETSRELVNGTSGLETTTTTTSTSTTTSIVIPEVFVDGIKFPGALAFDNTANLYTLETSASQILKYSPQREKSLFVPSLQANDLSFNANFGIFAATQTGASAFNLNGSLISVATGTLSEFVGPAFYNDNRVFSASKVDTAGTIFQITSNLFTLFTIGSPSGVSRIQDILADSSNNLYVSSGSSIHRVGTTGVFTLIAGGMLSPTQMVLNNGFLYVVEANGGRISRVNPSTGALLVLVSGLDSPSGVAIDSGYLYWTLKKEAGSIQRVILSQVELGN